MGRSEGRRKFLVGNLIGLATLVCSRVRDSRIIRSNDALRNRAEYPDHPRLLTVLVVSFKPSGRAHEAKSLEELLTSMDNIDQLIHLNREFIRIGKILKIFSVVGREEIKWTYIFRSWSAFREWEAHQRRECPIVKPSNYQAIVRVYPAEYVDLYTGHVASPVIAELQSEMIRFGLLG